MTRAPFPPSATPDEALALLQRHGLATAFSPAEFAAACAEQLPAREDDEDGDEPLDWDRTLVALASLYGTRGPTAVSLADRLFALDKTSSGDPSILARVREALAGWIGAPLPSDLPANIDGMTHHVADVLFLRHGGPQLYVLSATRPVDLAAIDVYLLRTRDPYDELPVSVRAWPIGPDTEAAAAGIFRSASRVPRAYAEHVFVCTRCRELLRESHSRGSLPDIYAELAARVDPR